MSECPWCKGVSGYKTSYLVSFTQLTEWNGEGFDSEQEARSGLGKTGECLDCGRRFRLSTLNNVENKK